MINYLKVFWEDAGFGIIVICSVLLLCYSPLILIDLLTLVLVIVLFCGLYQWHKSILKRAKEK